METGASPAGRDKSLLQFSACREQIWRVFRKLLLLMVGKCKSWKGPSVNIPFSLLLLMLELLGALEQAQ